MNSHVLFFFVAPLSDSEPDRLVYPLFDTSPLKKTFPESTLCLGKHPPSSPFPTMILPNPLPLTRSDCSSFVGHRSGLSHPLLLREIWASFYAHARCLSLEIFCFQGWGYLFHPWLRMALPPNRKVPERFLSDHYSTSGPAGEPPIAYRFFRS